MDIKTAVNKLNALLPLKARLEKLSPNLKALHKQVLYSLVNQGRPPTRDELNNVLGEECVESSLEKLGSDDLIVLDVEGRLAVGAYPVTIEKTQHKVLVNGHNIYAMCALDAVSVAPMFGVETVIQSRCHVSQTLITIRMHGSDILEALPTADITVGIRWKMPSAVAAYSMCMEMVFLKDRKTAMAWQNGDNQNISLFSLSEAVDFGRGFFRPLLS